VYECLANVDEQCANNAMATDQMNYVVITRQNK
jgi:hypothetical protein